MYGHYISDHLRTLNLVPLQVSNYATLKSASIALNAKDLAFAATLFDSVPSRP
jgi:hypothetical protein